MVRNALLLVGLALFCVVSGSVDPDRLKPCFEKYGYHKLAEATPFHSDGNMLTVDGCLVFCAKTTSRCRSIVYDRMTQTCHYFMVDGVELHRVIPSGRMDYFQLADVDCAANVIASSPADSTEIVDAEAIPPTSVEENGEKIPIMFAPEKFPQPPEATGNPATTTVNIPIDDSYTAVDIDVDPDLPGVDDEPTDAETVGIHPAGRKPSPKFDVKLDKNARNGVDETIIYDDAGDVARYVTHRPKVAEEEKLTDVRVPTDAEDDGGPIDDDDKDMLGEGDAAGEEKIVETEKKVEVEGDDYKEIPQNAAGQEYDAPEVIETPTTMATEAVEVTEATELATESVTESVEETEPTPDPRDDELKKLQEQLELLEKQMREVQKTTLPPTPQTVLPTITRTPFKPNFPKLPPSPAELMDRMALPGMVPEMKAFKLAKKPLPSSDMSISDEIRRAPQVKPTLAAAKQDFLNTVNNGPIDNAVEDESCPAGSSYIWIAVENSDLPRIGRFLIRRADTPAACIEQCERMSIDGHRCNQFVFYETSKQCAFGHEDDIFGVKAARVADFSTRAYKKLCYPDTISSFNDCSDFMAFRDYKLNIEPREVFDGLPTGREGVSSCVELCVLSNGFKCRSASFDFADGRCSIYSEHSLSAPADFKEHNSDSLLFFENGCIADSEEEEAAIAEAAQNANVQFGSLRVQRVNSAPSSEQLSQIGGGTEPRIIDFRKLKY
uniref:Apple domain-containing protein n=1 Tax=Panagrellus redivivus TaxID=6233 RepID=A0A7E4WCX6_PANRE